MTNAARLEYERDSVLALIQQVQAVLNRVDQYKNRGGHADNCVHAVAELRALLNPQEGTDA